LRLTRRSVVRTGVLAALSPILDRFGAPFLGASARAQEHALEWKHGLSLFGELKYPAGFKHFDYVNPSAPKAGSVRLMAVGTFDNFNEVVSGLKGSIAAGAGMLSDTLLAPSLDEVSTDYGLIAEAVTHASDFSSATFRLRANARHHDGKPVTVEDVIFSMQAFKKHSPMTAAYYRHVTKMEQTGEREVIFIFDAPGNREMPLILGQLNVLPKHWWEGTDASGKKRDISTTTLEPPLGCGAYRIKDLPRPVSGSAYTYLFGPQFSHRGEHWTPFVHALFGAARLSDIQVSTVPSGSAFFNRSFSQNSFATALGMGLDGNFNKHIGVRIFQVEYLLTKFTCISMPRRPPKPSTAGRLSSS